MVWLRSCPRCQGDLASRTDMYGPFVMCLQCGYYLAEDEDGWLTQDPLQTAAQATPSNEAIEAKAS